MARPFQSANWVQSFEGDPAQETYTREDARFRVVLRGGTGRSTATTRPFGVQVKLKGQTAYVSALSIGFGSYATAAQACRSVDTVHPVERRA